MHPRGADRQNDDGSSGGAALMFLTCARKSGPGKGLG